jgi:hypothetical protein
LLRRKRRMAGGLGGGVVETAGISITEVVEVRYLL